MAESGPGRRLVLVTGAGRGLGRAIALRLAADGFLVAGCSRTKLELDETRVLSKGEIRVACVDVAKQDEIERWVSEEIAAGAKSGATPWGLVTAAGIHGDIGPVLDADWRAWRLGLEVNLYGTAYACAAFARSLRARKSGGRIAILSGGGATKAMENLSSYCASKSAVVRFGETLARELAPLGITVNAIAPGAVNTAITRTIIDAGPAKAGRALFESAEKQLREGGAPPDKAANLASYLMSEASAPVTGRLISAVWDDWARLHENAALLADREAYTLVRKVPAETR